MDNVYWKKGMLFLINKPRGKVYYNDVKFDDYNVLRNLEFPSEVFYHDNGTISILHYDDRQNKPNYIHYNENGIVTWEAYTMKKGGYHRENGPAAIFYDPYNNMGEERYYKNDILDREDGPARIVYWNNKKMLEVYYVNGIILNRNNGPASIEYYNNGNVKQEKYYAENRNL